MALDQQAADEVEGDELGGAGEEGVREGWEVVYGFGSGLGDTNSSKPLLHSL